MKCDHKKYNPYCTTCRDIVAGCGYAMKHGWADFGDDYETNAEEWTRMVDYYNRPEPEPDESPDMDELPVDERP